MAAAIAISLTLVLVTVFIHYEGLRVISRGFRAARAPHNRRRLLLVIFLIFMIHIVEIAIYAFAFWFADVVIGIGSFGGGREMGLINYFYFSAETFSTLGLGDIYPVGWLRLLASIEPINGLLLIGWSISFTFLVMQRYWFFDNEAIGKDPPSR